MRLTELMARAGTGNAAIYTFERGKSFRYPFSQLAQDAARARVALSQWGVKPRMRVGIYAPNSYQWVVYDLALIEIGAISVPFTDDFAGMVNQELLDRYNISLLLMTTKHAKQFSPKPSHVAFIDADNTDVAVQDRPPLSDPDLEDQHSLVFSSGSAGGLKGLVISRKGVETTLPPINEAIGVEHSDRVQLFLPLSNFQQRNMCYTAIWYDCDIIITDYTELFAAMKALNPTVLVAPPVLYEMIFAEFENAPLWKRQLANALGVIISLLPGERLRSMLARRVFKKLVSQFGAKMRLLITGMAPIRRDLGKFFARMQIPLCESYGMVEVGSITFRPAGSKQYDSVGRLLSGIEISFREDGEILVHREKPLTLRYFQCAEAENERTFIAPGTIATGDMGRLDDNGNLILLGRKKEIIITQGGLKIHPEVIEQELNTCPEVARSVAFLKPGATTLTCVIDLVQPEVADAKSRARKFVTGLRSTKKAFSYVDVVFSTEPFSTKNGMLRPNMKLDRKNIAAQYSV